MLCQDCQQKPASVHFTQIVNDEAATLHLCPACARARGLKTTTPATEAPLSDFLSEMGAPIFTSATSANVACPRCGCTFRQFRKTGRLGCAHCYTTFEKEMGALLRKIHGSSEHVGISEVAALGLLDEREARLHELRRQLRQAVVQEEYERAAELRDAIQDLEEPREAVEARAEDEE
jgi:protein arginine kinase activator